MSRNQRLYDAIRHAGKRLEDLADDLDADPKTVGRWINDGRLPRPHHRQKLAQVLGVPEAVLWPNAPGVGYGTSELVAVYTTRRELPPSTVSSLLDTAEQNIDVLGYASLWLWDTVPDFVECVEVKTAQGVTVRICLGDPDSEAVQLRGREEGVGEALAARCRLALTYAQGIHQVAPSAVRITGATLYASILRFDDDILLNTHLWGNPAADSPVFHFRQRGIDGIAVNIIKSFNRVWNAAQPLSEG
jgi:transcriptional regulator with XRE-family HTH domain